MTVCEACPVVVKFFESVNRTCESDGFGEAVPVFHTSSAPEVSSWLLHIDGVWWGDGCVGVGVAGAGGTSSFCGQDKPGVELHIVNLVDCLVKLDHVASFPSLLQGGEAKLH